MAVRSIRAYIHNETGLPLHKISDECPHGEWTSGAPVTVEPNIPGMMRARANLVGGVEFRASYQIGDDPGKIFYIHANNPISGSNSYHTNAPRGTYAFFSAPSSGSDPVAHFILRPAGRYETDFLPSRDGFKFSNSWDNAPYTLPPLRNSLLDQKYGNADDGLCGGMVLAALDYFAANQEIPSTRTAPPGEQDPLFKHLVDRLFDTFSVDTVTLMLKLMNPAYPDGDENILNTFGFANGRAAVMAIEEWPLIRGDIDSGKPSPMCLIAVKSLNPGDLGDNHQVLAYAYEADEHDIKLHVYDPNSPEDDNIVLKFRDGDVSNRIYVEHNVDINDKPIYCFIRMDNGAEPVPFNTKPRLTAAERQARRVRLSISDRSILETNGIASGQETFPIYPDCGEARFNYSIEAQALEVVLSAATPYYQDPLFKWLINGSVVQEGNDRTMSVLAEADCPNGTPLREGVVPPAGCVNIRTTLSGNTLTIRNDPLDGNYALWISVSAQESGRPETRTSSSRACNMEGLAFTVFGLAEARAECWRKYLNRHRKGLPKVKVVAEMLFAQTGRPADPLWDPDPSLMDFGSWIAREDPLRADINQWKLDLDKSALELGGKDGTDTLKVDGKGVQIDTITEIETAKTIDKETLEQGLSVDKLKLSIPKPP